jgi:hypothetical protein
MRLFDSLLFLIAGIVIGGLMFAFFTGGLGKKHDPMPDIKQQILLERIKKVAKLITVEGEFSNVHQYKDPGSWNLSITTKKAIMRVKARVSVGYDMQKIKWEVDSANRIIRIRDMPEPEILSIDHDVEYYDIQEGMFNSFTEDELTSINIVIKKRLRKEAEKGPLMDKAREEGLESLEIIKILVEQAGWTFQVVNGKIDDPNMLDSLKNINIPDPKRKITDSLMH